MSSTSVENIVCPHCGVLVIQVVRQNGFRAGGSSIGPSAIPCHGCGIWLATGTTEWDEKGIFQKSGFILSRLLWFVVGSFLVAGFLGALVGLIAVEAQWIEPEQRMRLTMVAYLIFTLLIGWIMARNTLREIRDSRRRVAEADAMVDSESVAEE